MVHTRVASPAHAPTGTSGSCSHPTALKSRWYSALRTAFFGSGHLAESWLKRDRSGWTHTWVVDTTTKQTREIKAARSEPIFLTSNTIWYQGERACVAADNCQGQSIVQSGMTYIYDLQSRTEAEAIINSVADVWPHGA